MLFLRALAYKRVGQYDLALADYDQVLALDPDAAEVYVNRGAVYMVMKNYASALADYNRAIELAPDLWQAYYNRANAHEKLGNSKQTNDDLIMSVRLKTET